VRLPRHLPPAGRGCLAFKGCGGSVARQRFACRAWAVAAQASAHCDAFACSKASKQGLLTRLPASLLGSFVALLRSEYFAGPASLLETCEYDTTSSCSFVRCCPEHTSSPDSAMAYQAFRAHVQAKHKGTLLHTWAHAPSPSHNNNWQHAYVVKPLPPRLPPRLREWRCRETAPGATPPFMRPTPDCS